MTRHGDPLLKLGEFLPYRLSVVTNKLSRTLARLYQQQFALTIPEWRVMAVLGETPGLTADEIGATTEMDKVTVSRAVSRMRAKAFLTREVKTEDRRRFSLKLTPRGFAVYGQVVPLAKEVERDVLAGLSRRERDFLDRVLSKLDVEVDRLAAEVSD